MKDQEGNEGPTELLSVALAGHKALLADTTPVAIFRVMIRVLIQANLVVAAAFAKQPPTPPAVRFFLKEDPREWLLAGLACTAVVGSFWLPVFAGHLRIVENIRTSFLWLQKREKKREVRSKRLVVNRKKDVQRTTTESLALSLPVRSFSPLLTGVEDLLVFGDSVGDGFSAAVSSPPNTRARLPAEFSTAGEEEEVKAVGLVGESSARANVEADFGPEGAVRSSPADLGAASVENDRMPFGAKASVKVAEIAEKLTGGSFGGFANQFLIALPGLEPSDPGSSMS